MEEKTDIESQTFRLKRNLGITCVYMVNNFLATFLFNLCIVRSAIGSIEI